MRGTLAIYVLATIASFAGTRLSTVAIPWFVLTTTHSVTRTGLVAFAELLPYVLVKALGGPLIDRIGPVRVAVGSDILALAAIGLVPLLHAFNALTFPLLVTVVAVLGTVRGPGDGAKATLIPSVAHASGTSLERVSGTYGAVDRLAATLGTAIGGLVVAAVGGAYALAVTAATFALSGVVLGWGLAPALRRAPMPESGPAPAPTGPPPAPGSPEPGPTPAPSRLFRALGTYASDLRAGWQFLRTDTVLLAVVAVLSLTNLLEQAYAVILVPVWALHGGHGPATVGLVFATMSASAVIGSVLAAALGERFPRRPAYLLAYLLVGLPRFGILASGADLPIVLGVLAVGGVAAGFINPIIGAVVVERIPLRLLGRVNSLVMALAWALLPFGGPLGALLLQRTDISHALWSVGIVYLFVTMSPALLPAWRGIDRPAAARTVQA